MEIESECKQKLKHKSKREWKSVLRKCKYEWSEIRSSLVMWISRSECDMKQKENISHEAVFQESYKKKVVRDQILDVFRIEGGIWDLNDSYLSNFSDDNNSPKKPYSTVQEHIISNIDVNGNYSMCFGGYTCQLTYFW